MTTLLTPSSCAGNPPVALYHDLLANYSCSDISPLAYFRDPGLNLDQLSKRTLQTGNPLYKSLSLLSNEYIHSAMMDIIISNKQSIPVAVAAPITP